MAANKGGGRKWQREQALSQSPPSSGGKPYNKSMPGCCGGAKPVVYQSQVTRDGRTKIVRVDAVSEEEGIVSKVAVEFIGHRIGGFNVYGPVTKRAYRFSIFRRVVEIEAQDVEQVLLNRDFRLVRPELEIPEKVSPRRGYNPKVDTQVKGEIPVNESPAARAAREAVAAGQSTSDPSSNVAGTHSAPIATETQEPPPARKVRSTGPPVPADPSKSSIEKVMAKERSRSKPKPQEVPEEERDQTQRVRRVRDERGTSKVDPKKILGG